MDSVMIEGLAVSTTIGVYDWEQTIKQTLYFDIEMEWDNQVPAKSDDVSDCLNYALVSQTVIHFVENGCFNLIERVAEEVAQLLLSQFTLNRILLKVSKPGAVAEAKNVAVKIQRYAKTTFPNEI